MILVAGQGRLAGEILGRLSALGLEAEPIASTSDANQIGRASVVVLSADDDAGNVDAALRLRRLHANLPLIARLYDSVLASYLTGSLPMVTVLSASGVAGPLFADAAQRVIASHQGRKIAKRPPSPRRRRSPQQSVLLWALAAIAALVVPSTFFFAHALRLRLVDSLYFVWATVTTVGYGDISLRDASDGAKVAGMFLMFAGVIFMAVLLALITDWVVSRRLDVLSGRVRVRGHGHVIVVGAGNVGTRVAESLRKSGVKVVVIERDDRRGHLEGLRALGVRVIVADGTSEEVLELAGIDRASAVLAITERDTVNLRVELLAQARRPDLPVVLRVTSPELSEHISQHRGSVAISSIAAAADAFAAAAQAAALAPRGSS
jgi:voltage-gated potassium channel Kch